MTQKFARNPALGNWDVNQRMQYKRLQNGHTSCINTHKKQIKRLESVGFEWSIYSSFSWSNRYKELVKYVKEFRNSRVPQKFARSPALGHWVMSQTSAYKKFQPGIACYSLTGDKIQLLDKIGFESSIHESWDAQYKELVRYVKEFGNA